MKAIAKLTILAKRIGKFTAMTMQPLIINPFVPTVPTFAVRETASLGIMGEPRVPPLNLIMPRDAVSRTANVERNGGHKWVKPIRFMVGSIRLFLWCQIGPPSYMRTI